MGEGLRLEDCAVVFEPADPPRCSTLHLWSPDGEECRGPAPEGTCLAGTDDRRRVALPVGGRAQAVEVPTRRLSMPEALPALVGVGSRVGAAHPAAAFWAAATEVALGLVARGRLLPGVSEGGHDAWRIGPLEVADVEALRALAAAMPAAARALLPSAPAGLDGPAPRLPDAEELVRTWLDAVADTLPRSPGAAWLTADPRYADPAPVVADEALVTWSEQVSLGVDSGLQVALRLEVPGGDFGTTPFTAVVRLRDLGDPTSAVDAEELWSSHDHDFGERATFDAMLAVRRAARVWSPLESLLSDPEPVALTLVREDVEDLLDGAEDRLAAAGIDLTWPPGLSRELNARAVVSAGNGDAPDDVAAFLRGAGPLSLRWQLTLGGEPLTDAETGLVGVTRAIVRLRNQWVLVPPELAHKARERPLPPLPPWDGLGAALIGSVDVDGTRVEAVADGWLGEIVARLAARDDGPEPLGAPARLHAELRGYQQRGVRWLHRMTSLGLGGCLADDMGLGKTITLIALHLRRRAEDPTLGPTLVVCPASVLGTWEREVSRFAPGETVIRYHGAKRRLPDGAGGFVLTTYATMRADAATLAAHPWGMITADEAQNIKNPTSDTARALRTLPAPVRVALSGTPVENNLGELWALLDWTTPGLLDRRGTFRARWARPVESEQDTAAVARLSRLVHPFLLRRLKSDPGIAPELPPKVETDHPVSLTAEQVSLYERVVDEVMSDIRGSRTEIARRGHVLKLLVGLKQVCNHPAHYLREGGDPAASRSEKLQRLDEIVETVLDEGGAALVFTQYVQMATLLERHLAGRGVGTQFLHGGTSVARREEMVRRFQAGEVPVFLLSLKAAGTGLTLTRADHVIHYDRWWNPAVEEQATDRAHRIGQTRSVQVHRITARGTLEERIADLLESKKELADAVLDGGEAALGDLSTAELARLVELRSV